MCLFLVIFISSMNSIVLCTNPNKLHLFDTSSTSTSTQYTSLSSSETSSRQSSSTTHRRPSPDTSDPGAIAGIAIGSLLLIIFISVGSYYIRRQRLYYLPYYNHYRPI